MRKKNKPRYYGYRVLFFNGLFEFLEVTLCKSMRMISAGRGKLSDGILFHVIITPGGRRCQASLPAERKEGKISKEILKNRTFPKNGDVNPPSGIS